MIVPIQDWQRTLQPVLESCAALNQVTILGQTDSTQDEARRINAQPGHVIIAVRQTAGRGRMGRTWIDDRGEGLAVSIVVAVAPPERLAVLSAVAVAHALQAHCPAKVCVGIKWPNDIVVNDRKLAGILVEQDSRRAIIGIGINVEQKSWPDELRDRAVSLHQLGARADHLTVLRSLLPALDAAMALSDDELLRRFAERDALVGKTVTLYDAGRAVTGRVHSVSPRHGIVVQTDQGERHLPAATVSTHPPA